MFLRAEGGTAELPGLEITASRLRFALERQVREVGDTRGMFFCGEVNCTRVF